MYYDSRFSLEIRPVETHSATKILPSWVKQASCGWTNFPGSHFELLLRIAPPLSDEDIAQSIIVIDRDRVRRRRLPLG